MQPTEQPTEERFTSLYQDIELIKAQLSAISSGIRQEGVSNYPIFIAHQEEVILGKQLFHAGKQTVHWHVSISILEDLVNKEIIDESKVDDFRKVYKDPSKLFCFLVLTADEMQFVFTQGNR